MYCKLFASLYQGTLRGKSHEILVFTNLLAHCDAQGFVDKHWKAISDEVGLTIEEVKEAILVLESPDPESRSHDYNGARIIKMDGHRAWGWRVVNYEKYRAIRDEEDRREQNRLAQQRFRENHKPPSAIVSRGKPPSAQGEGEGEGYYKPKKTPFQKPTLEEVSQYGVKISLVESESQGFMDHHEARGWVMSNGKPMVNWQAALRTWKRNGEKFALKAAPPRRMENI